MSKNAGTKVIFVEKGGQSSGKTQQETIIESLEAFSHNSSDPKAKK